MAKEEQVLFPYIDGARRRRAQRAARPVAPFGTVANPIRMMEIEHQAAATRWRRSASSAADYTPPADACTTFR